MNEDSAELDPARQNLLKGRDLWDTFFPLLKRWLREPLLHFLLLGTALVGLALAAFVVIAIFSSFVVPLRRQWTLIIVRAAGSWTAASGLLMLGWTLR